MTYTVTPEDIQAIRYEVSDSDPAMPMLSDAEISYYLTKNTGSIAATTLDAARVILMKLAQSGDTTVGILSFRGAKAAEQYAAALRLMLRDPSLNPLTKTATGYAGGISKADMQANDENLDNNIVKRHDTYNGFNGTSFSDLPTSIY